MDGSSVRKSGRRRQQSQRYPTDSYIEVTTLEHESDTPTTITVSDDDEGEDAFDPEAIQRDEGTREVSDEDSDGDDGDLDGAGAGFVIEDEQDLNVEASSDMTVQEAKQESMTTDCGPTGGVKKKRHQKSYVKKGPSNQLSMREDQSYTRGLLEPKTKGSKEAIKLFLFGPAIDDQQAALRAAYRWRSQLLLPSRKADKSGAGGFVRSFYTKDADLQREMDEDWQWHDTRGGREEFARYAVYVKLNETTAEPYMPSASSSLDVVMGPRDRQQKYRIDVQSSLDLDLPFSQDGSVKTGRKRRSGWLLNVGDRVQALAWAPNQLGAFQYLLVATVGLVAVGVSYLDGQRENLSHFEPQSRSKSSCQIWQFEVRPDGKVDNTFSPRLRQVICTDWGDTRSIKWCPAPRREAIVSDGGQDLGLVAGIWADGAARVLKIDLPASTTIDLVRCVKAAFTARSTDSVFSSIVWLSSHGLAIGSSIGTVSIYNLSDCLQSGPDNPNPVLLSSLQNTYIVSMVTCAPSRPHILIASAMSGFISMTDLHRVTASTGFNASNTVFAQRNRIGRGNIAWHDWSQVLLNCDELNSLSSMAIRRFHVVTGVSRFRSAVRSLATSEAHPFVAAAGYGGEVTVCNPMKRLLSPKEDMHTLRWFLHTWRRDQVPDTSVPGLTIDGYAAPEEDEDKSGVDVTKAYKLRRSAGVVDDSVRLGRDRKGTVRFVEGFKPEVVSLAKMAADKDPRGPVVPTTVYEAETAVTTIVWNNNIHVGGWLAAGTASGLVRVEDISMD